MLFLKIKNYLYLYAMAKERIKELREKILYLKSMPPFVQSKQTIQKLQQELDDLIFQKTKTQESF